MFHWLRRLAFAMLVAVAANGQSRCASAALMLDPSPDMGGSSAGMSVRESKVAFPVSWLEAEQRHTQAWDLLLPQDRATTSVPSSVGTGSNAVSAMASVELTPPPRLVTRVVVALFMFNPDPPVFRFLRPPRWLLGIG